MCVLAVDRRVEHDLGSPKTDLLAQQARWTELGGRGLVSD